MTITYTLDVSSSKFRSFTKLLLRWRGSVWKVVWKELLLWLFFYSIISLIYRFAFNAYQREVFEDLVAYCLKTADQIPLTFMLGFYVTLVVNRWANMFSNIGWIDNIALHLAAYISETDDDSRMLRRNCVRYMVLTQALVFRNISTPVRKRFPTYDTLVTAGLMTEQEKAAMDRVISPHKKNYLPTHWSMTILRRALKDGRLTSDLHLRDFVTKENEVRMVRKISTMSTIAPRCNENGHRLSTFSECGTLSRKSSGRLSRRFSEMLKNRFGRRSSKSLATTQPSVVEKGDFTPSLQVFNIPTPTSPHFRSDRTSPSSTNDVVLSTIHHDDMPDDIFSSDPLEMVPEVEEIDENPTNISRHSSDAKKQ